MYVVETAVWCGVVLYTVSMILSFECDLKFIVTHSLNAGLHIILAAEHWPHFHIPQSPVRGHTLNYSWTLDTWKVAFHLAFMNTKCVI